MFSRCATETIVNFYYLHLPNQEGLDRLRRFKESGFRPEFKIRLDLRERHAAKEGSELDPSEVEALEGLNDFWSTHSLPDKVVDLPPMKDRLLKSGMDPKTDLFFFWKPTATMFEAEAEHSTRGQIKVQGPGGGSSSVQKFL
jgi:hypothetical protein